MKSKAVFVMVILLCCTEAWIATIPASTFANDLYPDGIVYDFKDFAVFGSHWMGVNCSQSDWCNGCDFDMSDSVDPNDLKHLANYWLSITADDLAMKDSARDAADAGFEQAKSYFIDSFESAPNKYVWKDSWYDETGTTIGYSFGPVTHGDAEFQYDIYKGNEITDYEIVSTGTADSVVHTVHAAIILRGISIISGRGIMARGSIDVHPGGGLYTFPIAGRMIIQTDSITKPPAGGIIISKDITVPGDVIIGEGGDINEVVKLGRNATIEGEILSAPTSIQYPPISPPSLAPGVLTQDPCDPDIWIINADGEFGPLNIGTASSTPKTIRIEGNNGPDHAGLPIPLNVYINGDLMLGAGAKLIVAEGSAVDLYLGGSMKAKNGSVITYGNISEISDPSIGLIYEASRSLTIKGTDACDSIILNNSSDFYGAFCVPSASLDIRNSGDFYGEIFISGETEISNSDNFYCLFRDLPFLEVHYMGCKHGSWWEDFVGHPDSLKEIFESVVRKSRSHSAMIGHADPSLRLLYYSVPNISGDPDMDPDMYAEFYMNGTDLMLAIGSYDPETGAIAQTSTKTLARNVTGLAFSTATGNTNVEMTITFIDRTATYSASSHN